MVREGKEKQEVVDYMVARYGNFILYDPPDGLDPDPLAWPLAGHRDWRRHRGGAKPPPCPAPCNSLKHPECEEQASLAALLKEEEKQ
jgi:cytochrome c-type biogenesis protein CcmH